MAPRTRIFRTATTPGEVLCPFKIVVDSHEQLPYTFHGLRTTKDEGDKLIQIETITHGLHVGDYAIDGMPGGIIIERKSKEDMFKSIVDRDNCKRRLGLMSDDFVTAHWIVECELTEVYRDPPSQYNPTALMRSVWAWNQRYPKVHWHWVPGRRFGEQLTFRLLERYYTDSQRTDDRRSHQVSTRTAYRRGVMNRMANVAYDACPYEKHTAEESHWDAGWRDMNATLSKVAAKVGTP